MNYRSGVNTPISLHMYGTQSSPHGELTGPKDIFKNFIQFWRKQDCKVFILHYKIAQT